ncbi:hypothetical protein, partial [Flavobacterium sp.]|uniref:hypothetical protein n=1 Tax=Flavobacterium sp. TaxID=239 RepID=UPI000ECE8176
MLTNKVKAWRFGTIKFYSTQKGFGYLYCKSEQYKIKEYFFDSTALQKGEVLENQNVCFYFGMENGKLKICEISPITLELF